MASIDQIKQLREETSVSISECRKALIESDDDFDKAKEILRKMGREIAGKRLDREAMAGIVHSYIHSNEKIGVLLELRCESDFVAKSKDFKELAHELCLQIAAMNPLFVKEEDIPEDFLAGEREIYREQFKGSGKPKNVIDGIVEGKLKKYKDKIILYSQPWIKDDTKTIKDLLDEYFAKLGENIIIKRFERYEA